jgi:hypothetical protein
VNRLRRLQERLAPLKAALLDHPVYKEIDRIDALRTFMAHHVFAVWDFMSLLKSLQRHHCCVDVPWLPAADGLGSRLVNAIVVAEESDDDGRGGFASHFVLYRRAMVGCGADAWPIDGFIAELRRGSSVTTALDRGEVPECARRFVRRTFAVIDGADPCGIAAAFAFGREDLLPAMFQRMVDELNVEAGGGLDDFVYYLDRHIGLDGDEHGPMAHQILASLCGADESCWHAAERAAVDSLEARKELWDGIHGAIRRTST